MTTARNTKAERAARAKRAREAGRVKAAEQAKPTPKPDPAEKAVKRTPVKRSTKPASYLPPRVKPTRSSNELDLNKVITEMELEHVQCRDFGHSWRPFHARWMQQFNAYESQLQCLRCKTVRTRFLSRTGQQLESKYDYTEGYLVKGMGRLTGTDRDIIRLASILAVLEDGESK